MARVTASFPEKLELHLHFLPSGTLYTVLHSVYVQPSPARFHLASLMSDYIHLCVLVPSTPTAPPCLCFMVPQPQSQSLSEFLSLCVSVTASVSLFGFCLSSLSVCALHFLLSVCPSLCLPFFPWSICHEPECEFESEAQGLRSLPHPQRDKEGQSLLQGVM